MTQLKGKIALVTGASIGIGQSVAERLVKLGVVVYGCARNEEALNQIASSVNKVGPGRLIPIRCDVTQESEIMEMFATIKEKFGKLHICINNAGLGHDAPLLSGATKDWKNMLDVNVLGLSICTREAYKLMEAGNVDDGHFININSMSGHRIVGLPFYSATKFAVTALTEGLRRELRAKGTHIRSTSISPGLVETDFAYRMRAGEPEKAKKVYESLHCLQANDIADAVIFALEAPPNMDVNDILIRPTEQSG